MPRMAKHQGPERDCPMYVVLYARASSDRQADKGLSVPAQFREMRAYCDTKGYAVLGELRV